tara:strand:+ start:96 stop:716 length:621 start_codon:yes stop_codon:yes gene_type:complete
MSKLKVDQISKATGASPAIFTLPAADGTAGQYMKTDGSGNLGFVSAAAGAKIGQVVQTTKTDSWLQSTTDQTYYNPTGFSRTITPVATSSKVLILACCSWSATTNYEVGTKITRTIGGVEEDILIADTAGSRTRTFLSERSNGAADYASTTVILLDSPNTTSEITYKPVAATESSATLYLNRQHSDSDSAGEFRAASNIICVEVLA